jgi:anti-sigma factor RsiW
MDCPMETRGGEDLLLDYTSGRLAPAAAAGFERHLEHCERCRTWANSQKAVWSALEAWEAPPAPAGFDRELYRRIEQETHRDWWAWPALRLRPALSLAVATVLVFFAFLVQFPKPAKQTEVVDADRLERALDDVDMLRELSLAPAPASDPEQM